MFQFLETFTDILNVIPSSITHKTTVTCLHFCVKFNCAIMCRFLSASVSQCLFKLQEDASEPSHSFFFGRTLKQFFNKIVEQIVMGYGASKLYEAKRIQVSYSL